MLKFTYQVDESNHYVFRYHEDTQFSSVLYPNNTSSEKTGITDVQTFEDWVEAIIGEILPPDTLSLFQYVFDKEIRRGNGDFTIQAAYLVSNCMSNSERDGFKAEAIRIDNEYFARTGYRFNLDRLQIIYVARHRVDAHILLTQLRETLNAS